MRALGRKETEPWSREKVRSCLYRSGSHTDKLTAATPHLQLLVHLDLAIEYVLWPQRCHYNTHTILAEELQYEPSTGSREEFQRHPNSATYVNFNLHLLDAQPVAFL